MIQQEYDSWGGGIHNKNTVEMCCCGIHHRCRINQPWLTNRMIKMKPWVLPPPPRQIIRNDPSNQTHSITTYAQLHSICCTSSTINTVEHHFGICHTHGHQQQSPRTPVSRENLPVPPTIHMMPPLSPNCTAPHIISGQLNPHSRESSAWPSHPSPPSGKGSPLPALRGPGSASVTSAATIAQLAIFLGLVWFGG